MNVALFMTVIALLAGLVSCLGFLEIQGHRTSARLRALEHVVCRFDEHLRFVSAPPPELGIGVPEADETDVQDFVDDFYRDLDILTAIGFGTGEVDSDGSYPSPTPEELAELDANIANERFQPPTDTISLLDAKREQVNLAAVWGQNRGVEAERGNL